MELTVDLSPELLERLEVMAGRMGQDASELVTRLIKSYLATVQDPTLGSTEPDYHFQARLGRRVEHAPPAPEDVPETIVIPPDEPPVQQVPVFHEVPIEPLILWLLAHTNIAPPIPLETLNRRRIYAKRG